jgi:hypothetical protein
MREWKLFDWPIPYLKFEVGRVWFVFTTKRGIPFEVERIHHLRQIHSSRVLWVSEIEKKNREGDGILTSKPNLWIGIKVADCYPIYLTSRNQTFAGILHAGWRGLKDNIIEKGIGKVLEIGLSPRELVIAVGPGICKFHYEIKEDLLPHFEEHIERRDGRLYLDLRGVISSKLRGLGIADEQIVFSDFCTFEREDFFHSRRRDGIGHGTQWALAIIKS